MRYSTKIIIEFKIVSIVGLLCLIFISCGTKYSKEISQLDSLKTNLVHYQTDLLSMDTTRLLAITDDITDKLSYIQNNYSDTVNFKLAQTLDAYDGVKKSIILWLKQYDTLKVNIVTDTSRIKNLIHDLQYNIFDKEKVIGYCNEEQKEVERIGRSFDVIKQLSQQQIKKNDSLKPFIEQILFEIKTKQESN